MHSDVFARIEYIEKWIDDCYKRNDLNSFDVIMDIAIESGNYLREMIILCSGIASDDKNGKEIKGFDLHEAVIVGHMVRIYKMYDQIVFFVAENKGEISSIFFRLLFETYVKMKYFMLRGPDSIDSFIKCSFKAPMKNYNYIVGQEDDGVLDTIGKRVINKIENRLRFVNLSIEEMVSNRNWKIDG